MTDRRIGAVALMAGIVALLSVVFLVARCGFGGPDRPDLENVAEFDGSVVGGAQIGDEVRVVVRPSLEVGGNLSVVDVSVADGGVVAESDLGVASAMAGVAEFDGNLVLRVGMAVPGLDAEVRDWPPSIRGRRPQWLLVVDGESLSPVTQYSLPSFDAFEPLIVEEGKYWAIGNGWGHGHIDLATGEIDMVPAQRGGGGLIDVRRLGDRLLMLWREQIRIADLQTGDLLVEHWFRDYPRNGLAPGTGFCYFEDQFWMSGSGREDWDQFYRYDMESGEMSDPRSAEDCPTWSFEAAGYRWEAFSGRVFPSTVAAFEPEPGDVWHQVDVETGETVGEYDFDDWEPRFGTDGFLWLTRDLDDGGQELARMALS